jgi:hypothetical protein
MQCSLTEAAQWLGITPRTLAYWLRQADIQAKSDGPDRRERTITLDELRQVAALHRRPLVVSRADLSVESLAARLEILEQSFHLLQRKVEQMGGGLAERVLRSVRSIGSDRIEQASNAAAYPAIKDVQVIVQAAIDLVNTAPPESASQSREIIVTFQGETDIFDLVPLLRREWRLALGRAMHRGWRVAHLIRQTEDLARAMTVAEDLMQLLTGPRGAYLPMFMPPSTTTSPSPAEFVVVPEVGVLELRSSTGRYIDVAIHHQPGRRFEMLYANFRRLREASTPMVTLYPSLSVEFSRIVAESENVDGNRYLLMDGLSELTAPLSVHRERGASFLAQTTDHDMRQKMEALLAVRAQREAIFERQIQRWQYRDMCPMQAIRHYIQTGIYSPDDIFAALGCPPLTPAQRVAHLTHLIHRLENCPNYELGLVDENVYDTGMYQTFWLVKAGHSVFLECQSRTAEGNGEEIDLAISNARIVDAFQEHYYRLWAQLVPVNRDKRHVIAWLKAQLAEIPQRG